MARSSVNAVRPASWIVSKGLAAELVAQSVAAPEGATAADVMRPVPALAAVQPVYAALATMRRDRTQFALVRDGASLLGLVTMQDLLDRLLPPAPVGAGAAG